MNRFLIDGDVNQRALRVIQAEAKGFDILLPEQGTYKDAEDTAIRKYAVAQGRVLVTRDKDFGINHLRPGDVPEGIILLRPLRTSQKRISDLLAGLCGVLVKLFPTNPYDFSGKIIEVFPDRVIIYSKDGGMTAHEMNPQ